MRSWKQELAATLSVVCAATSYSVTRWAFPPVGFEGSFAVAGFAWLGAIACTVYCVWSAIKYFRSGAPFAGSVICASIALLSVAFATLING